MSKIVKPPYVHQTTKPKYQDHVNCAVNLDLVQTISIRTQKYYPDNYGVPIIIFTFKEGDNHMWFMNSGEDAEKHYNLLTSPLGVYIPHPPVAEFVEKLCEKPARNKEEI